VTVRKMTPEERAWMETIKPYQEPRFLRESNERRQRQR